MYMFNLTLQSVHYSPKTEKSPSDYPTSSELTGDKTSENEKPKVISEYAVPNKPKVQVWQ